MSLEKTKTVVTGGRGFLGGFACRALNKRGAAVTPIGSSDYNLIEQADVRRMYETLQPELVIHLAAACGGIQSNVENPGRFLYENALMGLMLLEEGRRRNLKKFILISTICSYPKDAPLPLKEEDIWTGKPVGATGPYGMAKRLLHEACETYGRQYGMPCVVLVPSNLYGPEDHFEEGRSHAVPAIIRRYIEAKADGLQEVCNWGTGTPTREFLHVADAAEAIALAAQKDLPCEPINLGTGIETSIADLTNIIAAAVGYEGNVAWDTSKPDGQSKRFMDVSRARELLGFEAKISLKDGIRETVEWYRAQ
ncbi:MAG: GDP-fucose synthetase [Elusimicrobia bacterium]|nr:MAG: GDP-fucose synthetase [Elusimicrobiota bacterium]